LRLRPNRCKLMSAKVREPEKVLSRLDWTIIRRLDGLLQGDYRTLFHGFGLDLADLREYQFSDDIRYIDWNVTARMQTPYIRQYMEDRDVTAWFLLDLSPSMDFGPAQKQKRNLLIDITGALARLLTRHGNRVGAVLYDGKREQVIPARGGRSQALLIINDLLARQQLGRSPATDLAPLLETTLRMVKRRSLVFLISDFISLPGWEKALGALSRRHEVLAVRLYDRREIEIPDIGPFFFEDAETGEQLYIDTHDKSFRKRFTEAVARREYTLNTAFRQSGVDVLSLSTEDDLVREIVRFATLRKQRRLSPASFAGPNTAGLHSGSSVPPVRIDNRR
jgi:uncharacterized protein (DUF58 family)